MVNFESWMHVNINHYFKDQDRILIKCQYSIHAHVLADQKLLSTDVVFAVIDSFLSWLIYFCREQFVIAVSHLILQ